MREEKHKFKSGKLELVGVLTHPEIATGNCIILCHGITVDKDEDGIYTELANKLAEVGYHVFRFDFRGHGESQGNSVNMTVKGEVEDLEAAIKFLQKKGHKTFGIVASSFGGGPALFYTAEHQDAIKAIVLWNPLIDYHSVLDPQLPWPQENFGPEQMKFLNEKGYLPIGSRKFRIGKALIEEMISTEPFKALEKIDIPVLFIHGDKDTYVPYEDSVKYAKWPKKGEIITMEGADHSFHEKPEWAEKSDNETIKFLKKHV